MTERSYFEDCMLPRMENVPSVPDSEIRKNSHGTIRYFAFYCALAGFTAGLGFATAIDETVSSPPIGVDESCPA
jgi:hypothetical protein